MENLDLKIQVKILIRLNISISKLQILKLLNIVNIAIKKLKILKGNG